jgi:hypothetical protein
VGCRRKLGQGLNSSLGLRTELSSGLRIGSYDIGKLRSGDGEGLVRHTGGEGTFGFCSALISVISCSSGLASATSCSFICVQGGAYVRVHLEVKRMVKACSAT